MKIKELTKKTGLKLAAIVVIGGVIMFSFTACGKNQEVEPTMSTTIETTVEPETEEPGVVAGGLYNAETELGNGSTETAVEEEYTIKFKASSNEDIKAKDGETVVIPEYQRQHVKDMMIDTFDTFDKEDTENYTVLEETENEDGSTTYLISIANEEITNGCTTQYSVDENGKAKAIFVYKPLDYADRLASDFGINFELRVDKDGNVSLEKIFDLFGNDVSDITLYRGDCIGWSLTKGAIEVDFEFLDELHLSQDLTLYPVMENTYDQDKEMDTSDGYWVLGEANIPVKIGKSFEKNDLNFDILDGALVSIDGKKVVDPKTGVVTDAPKKEETTKKSNTENNGQASNGEQSSTQGGTGNAQTGGETTANTNIPDEPPTTSWDDFCNQFGMEPPKDSNTKNPNATGFSGAIQWGN